MIGDSPSDRQINGQEQHLNSDYDKAIESMTELLSCKNVTIYGANQFLLYHANTMILRHIVSKNKDLPDDIIALPNIDPKSIKIVEIDDHGHEKCIQSEEGMVGKNYFNGLMNKVMDGYYDALNYYEPE